MEPDLLEHVERTLAEAREQAASAVDRVEALVALRSRAFAIAARIAPEGKTLDAEALLDVDTERERAEVRALARRAFPEDA